MIRWLRDKIWIWRLGATRSGKWSGVRREFLKAHPTCAVCGKKGTLLKPLECHHVQPYHLAPSKELEWSNMITLCREHHFLFGHLLNWASYDPNIKENSVIMLERIKNRP